MVDTPKNLQDRVQDKLATRPQVVVDKDLITLERLEVRRVPIDSVYPNDYNPNRHDEEDFKLLVLSMEKDGFTIPLLVGEDRRIIDGEHRWMAAMTLGYEEVPVVIVNMSEVQRRISTLRHNKARGVQNADLEAEIFRSFKEVGRLDYLAENLGVEEEDLEALITDLDTPLTPSTSIDAWVPATMPKEEAELIEVADAPPFSDNESIRSHSIRAVAYHERQRRRLEDITDEAERLQLVRRMRRDEYELPLVFEGDEGDMVMEVLGDEPAEKLLELCVADLGPEKVKEILEEFARGHIWESYDEYLKHQKLYNDTVELEILSEEDVKHEQTER